MNSIIDLARDNLNRRKGEWPRIASESGLSYWWIIKFAQGRIENPGVIRIEAIQRWMAAHPSSSADHNGVLP